MLASAAVVAGLLVGCGGHSQPRCETRHELGACVREHFHLKKGQRPTLSFGGRPCIDDSQWQGSYPDLSGVRCIIIQSNYGTHVEPTVYSQMRDAREHGVPFGCYTFLEPGVSGEAQESVANQVCTISAGRKLGLWADAELNGTYEHTCQYTAKAQREGIHIEGMYSSPGLWPYSHGCAGDLWAAEWGGAPYPFAGYSWSQLVLRQYCGTCAFNGQGEQDLDEDRGLVALGQPTAVIAKPVLEARLRSARAGVAHFHILIERHLCRLDRRHHSHHRPHTHRQWVLCRAWLKLGQENVDRAKRLQVQLHHRR